MTALLCLLAAWSLDVSAGSAASVPTRLVIRQQGEADLDFVARYRTRPLAEVPYYDVRIGRGDWELELVHHKLYLDNRPPEVALFEITHGYNLILANLAIRLGWCDLRPGAGMVLSHPEATIRGERFDESRGILHTGWYAAGAAAQLGIGRELPLGRHWRIIGELKATAAWARVPVPRGTADVPNLAGHALVGVGFRN